MSNNLIWGIDPGTTKSALCIFDVDQNKAVFSETFLNEELAKVLESNYEHVSHNEIHHFRTDKMSAMVSGPADLAIEQVVFYGRTVGETTFTTVFWSGRFAQAWGRPYAYFPFREVGREICGLASGIKEPEVRQALIDRFGPEKRTAIGLKTCPGPLYNVKGHEWSALGIAVAHAIREGLMK